MCQRPALPNENHPDILAVKQRLKEQVLMETRAIETT